MRERKGERVSFRLDRLEIDDHGRVIIKDKDFAELIRSLRAEGRQCLAATLDNYCDPDSNCPVKNIGCGCPPPDKLCTCVGDCGCTSQCDCA